MNHSLTRNIERVKQILKEQGIEEGTYDDYQLDLIARGYSFPTFISKVLDEEAYFRWLASPIGSFKEKYKLITEDVVPPVTFNTLTELRDTVLGNTA